MTGKQPFPARSGPDADTGPWSSRQVRIVQSWPTRRDQPVSVALSPRGERLAWSVGQRLHVTVVQGQPGEPILQYSCALTPGLTWSPAGDRLAYRDEDGRGRLLDLSGPPVEGGDPRGEPFGVVSAMAFAPEGLRLATLTPSLGGRMQLSVIRPGEPRERVWSRTLTRGLMATHRSQGVNLAWSPNGRVLACTIGEEVVWLLAGDDGSVVRQFARHENTVTGLDWIDDEWLVSASEDATLQMWRLDDAAPPRVVETGQASGMAFVREQGTALVWTAKGELFAWSLTGATPTQVWYRESPVRNVGAHFARLAVSAVDERLALVDGGATDLLLVDDWNLTATAPASTTTYANAKVLLLGDSGVGKSALAMVLAGEPFQATESSHGRRIWRVPIHDPSGTGEREVLIWDLAGQPGYRIVHQLHLGGSSVALVLFDSRSETTPLAGVRHWARAVRHAHPVGDALLTTFLVAARIDRGGINVSRERVEQMQAEFALDHYVETSAKEARNVDELRARMLAAIDWSRIPTVTSTALFAAVKRFVVDRKAEGNLLTPMDEMCSAFQKQVPDARELLMAEQDVDTLEEPGRNPPPSVLTTVFEGCVSRLESAGLVKRLNFGDYVLLQPELLDAYAGAIVDAARDEPDGLGSILEHDVIDLNFRIPVMEHQLTPPEEKVLVFATLGELIRHELVLREPTEDGVQLVFPSAYRRDLPASEAPRGNGVVFRFEGAIANVYATLIVRLTRSQRFTRIGTWQSAARFLADVGECTVFLKSDGEGKAELWIGYEGVPDLLRMQFERFVHAHLQRRAVAGTVTRERQYSCPRDDTAFAPDQIMRVRKQGRDTILCPVCEQRVSLRDDYDSLGGADNDTAQMDASADDRRVKEAARTVLLGKEEVAEFDVFLCHNVDDKEAVRELAQRLIERGIRPWLDERELRPGLPWQEALEEQIRSIPTAAVIVGSRIGPWQNQELRAFLRQFAERNCPVIPVLLPGVDRPELPPFLSGVTWVDLAVAEPDPLDRLEWGITGRQPGR